MGRAQNTSVYVWNLAPETSWQDLKDHMRQAGEVVHAEVITEYNGRSKGCGIVEFATEEAAQEVRDLIDSQGQAWWVDRANETDGANKTLDTKT